jgi:putative hydrolase of the HAD superfamily
LETVKAIFFDLGDTLASTDPPYLHRIAQAMRESGLNISDKEFELEYTKADYKLFLKHKEEGGMKPKDYRKWFLPLLYESLLPGQDTQAVDQFRQNVRSAMSQIDFGRVALPGAVELLEYLKERGYRLAVISNNDGNTEEKCDEVNIREYFDIIFDSTNLDMIKPDPRIFDHALKELGLSTREAIHVGDMYGADIMGGMNAGLDVIWLNHREIEGLSHPLIKEVSELIEIKDIFK